MARSDSMVRGAAVVAAAVFVAGMVKLVLLRFQAGDIYPPYSSLRADPRGTKALHDSLDDLDQGTVRRNYRDLDRLAGERGRTLLYLGVRSRSLFEFVGPATRPATRPAIPGWSDPMEPLLKFAEDGGRLVLTLSPRSGPKGINWELARLEQELGFNVSSESPGDLVISAAVTVRAAKDVPGIEPELSWRSALCLKNLDPEWRTIYLRNDLPVMAERRCGRGSVVVATDSYFLSNEAMHAEPSPGVLAWLIDGDRAVFDERHLGVREDPGIATLGRRYHLAGMFFVLLGLAGLFIWKNAASFLPRDPAYVQRLSGASVSGRGSSAALLNLLRRTIPPEDLLTACLAEWDRSGGLGRSDPTGRRARAEAIVNEQKRAPKKHRDPVGAYRFICRILSERNQPPWN